MKINNLILTGATAFSLLALPMAGHAQPAIPLTVQQEFEAGAAATKAGNWAQALVHYDALENRIAKSKRSLAIVRIRKGEALYKLNREQEAALLLRAGLADIPTDDATLREDQYIALVTLGAIDIVGFDYASALMRFRAAEALADNVTYKVRAIYSSIEAGIFVDPQAALVDADRGIALLSSHPEAKTGLGRFEQLRGRALLNLGRFAEAQVQIGKAVQKFGGLGLKVNADDISARSDYAIAAMLAGKEDDARKYLAYTGAGRMKDGFGTGVEMELPACGGPEGLRPDDVAVVEFSIIDDGSIGYARPIYASRQGGVGLAFARVVAKWSWQSAQILKIEPFFRIMTRMELRCSTAAMRPSISALLGAQVSDWLKAKGVRDFDAAVMPEPKLAAALKSELAARESTDGANSIQLIPILVGLAYSSATPATERVIAAQRGLAIAKANDVPTLALLSLSINLWGSEIAAAIVAKNFASYAVVAKMQNQNFETALIDPIYVSNPVAQAALRIMIVDNYPTGGKRKEAIALLQEVVNNKALPLQDPFRVGALVRLASLEYAMGNVDAARNAYAQTGLSAQECALVDTKPELVSSGASYDSYPQVALSWGFEGWAKTEFDIAADGKTANQRTVIAYPPFIFGKAAVSIMKASRYEQSYRPEGGLGCSGNAQRVYFKLPG